MHEFFENQDNDVTLIADEVAERARAHGGKAIGTLKEFSEWTRLEERPNTYPTAHKMLSNLVNDHETMVRNLRQDAKKCSEEFLAVDTKDLLVGLLQKHEEMARMLRSFIEDRTE